jgi:hypothetical protein
MGNPGKFFLAIFSYTAQHFHSTMFIAKIKKLNATKAKLAALEKTVASELRHELASLPARYGFDGLPAFFKAVRAAGSGGGQRKGKTAAKKSSGRRRRAVITEATRAEVKKLAEAGKTGAEIAKAVRISLPSVQNVKKALGLVKSRK